MKNLLTFILLIISNLSFSQIVIIVDKLPDEHPGYDSIYLAADTNRWNPCSRDFRFTMNDAGFMQFKFVPGRDTLRFKICRGSWKACECDSNGLEVAKHLWIKGSADTLHLSVNAWRDKLPQNQIRPTANRHVQFVPTQLAMPQLDKKRTIRIYLPPNYFKYRSFPVIYMHDAQNLFDNSTAFSRLEWQVDEIMDALHYSHGFSAIVVGIYCDKKNRTNEFTPWKNDLQNIEGEGDKYARFIVKTLKPFIDDHYRSNMMREQTAIVGSGLGGLISLYAALEFPNVFGCAAALTPVVERCKKADDYFNKIKSKKPQLFYLAGGESDTLDTKIQVEQIAKALEKAGVEPRNILTHITPHAQCEEWYWSQEFENALRFFYNLQIKGDNVDDEQVARMFK